MGSIAHKLAVLITGSAAGFTAAAATAKKEVGGLTSTFGGAGAKISAIAGGIGVGLAAAFAVGHIKGAFEAIDATGKLADKLGVNTQSLTEMQYAASYANVSNEELGGSLGKLTKNLAEAADGTGPAADAFKSLGLDAADLVNEPLPQAFGEIADASNKMGNANQRNAALMAIFGKTGLNLIPLLQSGSAGLADMATEADQLGYSFSAVDSDQIQKANDAITKVENVLQGVANQVAIQLAPFIEYAANKLADFVKNGDGVGKVLSVFESLVSGVAYTADQFEIAKAAWFIFKGTVIGGAASIINLFALLAEGIDYVLEKLGKAGGTGFGEQLRASVDSLAKDTVDNFQKAGVAVDNFSNGTHAGQAESFFDGIRQKSREASEATVVAKQSFGDFTEAVEDDSKKLEKITDTIDDLRTKVEEFNFSDSGKAAAKLQREGATPEQVAEARGLQDQLDKMEEKKKLQEKVADDAQKLYDDTRTDAEKYAAEIEHINELLVQGAIDKDTAQRAADKAGADYAKTQKTEKPDKTDPAGLIQAGSAAAANFVAEIQHKQRGADASEKQLAEAKKGNNYLKDIRDAATNAPAFTFNAVDF